MITGAPRARPFFLLLVVCTFCTRKRYVSQISKRTITDIQYCIVPRGRRKEEREGRDERDRPTVIIGIYINNKSYSIIHEVTGR